MKLTAFFSLRLLDQQSRSSALTDAVQLVITTTVMVLLTCFNVTHAQPPIDLKVNAPTGEIYEFRQFGQVLWIRAEKGLFRCDLVAKNGDNIIPFPTGRVSQLLASEKRLVIDAANGTFFWNFGSTEPPVLCPISMGSIHKIIDASNTLWIHAHNGLYRFDEDSISPRINKEVGWIEEWLVSEGALWIRADKILYKWSGSSVQEPKKVTSIKSEVFHIYETASSVWINALGATYQSKKGINQEPQLAFTNISVSKVIEASDGTFWLNAMDDLYKLTRQGDLVPQKMDHSISILKSYESNQILWLCALDEIYYWPLGSKLPPRRCYAIKGSAAYITTAGEFVWIGTNQGIYRCKAIGSELSDITEVVACPVHGLQESSASLLWATNLGLYYCPKNAPTQTILIPESAGQRAIEHGEDYWLYGASGLNRWSKKAIGKPKQMGFQDDYIYSLHISGDTTRIGGKKGLYCLNGISKSEWHSGPTLTMFKPTFPFDDVMIPIEWTVENYERRTTRSLLKSRILLSDMHGNLMPECVPPIALGQHSLVLGKLPPGSYDISLEVEDLNGCISRSEAIRFRIYPLWLAFAVPIFSIATVLGLLLLLTKTAVIYHLRFLAGAKWNITAVASNWQLRFRSDDAVHYELEFRPLSIVQSGMYRGEIEIIPELRHQWAHWREIIEDPSSAPDVDVQEILSLYQHSLTKTLCAGGLLSKLSKVNGSLELVLEGGLEVEAIEAITIDGTLLSRRMGLSRLIDQVAMPFSLGSRSKKMFGLVVAGGDQDLDRTNLEIHRVTKLFTQSGIAVTSLHGGRASLAMIQQTLARHSGPWLFHYAGHVDKSDSGEWEIELHDCRLQAKQLASILSNTSCKLAFINGCNSSGMPLSESNNPGFGVSLARMGITFVGTQFSVDDSSAIKFALSFYKHLLPARSSTKGCTLAQAVLEARQAVGADAAYRYISYGLPGLQISLDWGQ